MMTSTALVQRKEHIKNRVILMTLTSLHEGKRLRFLLRDFIIKTIAKELGWGAGFVSKA